MKPLRPLRFRFQAMSLVEVAIAFGIMAFCLVAIVGLVPVMLNVVSTAREKGHASRIYQAVVNDLREGALAAGDTRYYEWDEEGFLLRKTTNAAAPGTNSERRYLTKVTSREGIVPAGKSTGNLVLSEIVIVNETRKMTNLIRPIWTFRNASAN